MSTKLNPSPPPNATAERRGLLSAVDQMIGGFKTFVSGIRFPDAAGGMQRMRMRDAVGNVVFDLYSEGRMHLATLEALAERVLLLRSNNTSNTAHSVRVQNVNDDASIDADHLLFDVVTTTLADALLGKLQVFKNRVNVGAILNVLNASRNAPQTHYMSTRVGIDLSKGNFWRVTFDDEVNFRNPLNMADGQSGIFLIDNPDGYDEGVFGSAWRFIDGEKPGFSSDSAKTDLISYYVDGGLIFAQMGKAFQAEV